MAQQRQSGSERYGIRTQGYTLNSSSSLPTSLTGGTADHVSLGIRVPSKQGLRNRRFGGRAEKNSGNWRKISIGFVALMLAVIGLFSVFGYYYYLSRDKEVSSIQMTSKRWGGSDLNRFDGQDDGLKDDSDFLTNVTRTPYKVLNFGHESGLHGRDSRYWDRDDRRRDGEYSGGASELANDDDHVKESGKEQSDGTKRMIQGSQVSDSRGVGLYNEAGRNELKLYEAKYEASLKNVGQLAQENSFRNKLSNGTDLGLQNNDGDSDDEYDDAIDFHDPRMTDYDTGNENENQNNVAKGQDDDTGGSSAKINRATRETNTDEALEDSNEALTIPEEEASRSADNAKTNSRHKAVRKGRSTKRFPSDMRKAPKRRKFTSSACEMKFLNSTALLVEPVESQKFSRFSLQYTDVEERPRWQEKWEPRFAGHQSLEEREDSFYARDQKINCGFVKGPQGYASTGFDISEDDKQFMLSCHTAVSSCIFGNSDNLRTPTSRTVTLLSKKNVCFVMFMDENTLQTLSSEGHKPDRSGFIGLWKIVVVKNLPYADMRRVGKIPKFLTHRLFPSARYSIWLDSKLRLQNDPLLILEYFLWRKGYEYAISNHYDRHCVWEEVAQNKRLNKFNHTVIDEQFQFYQADGLQRFNASDPNKLLPSNVPEGSFIVRAHTPMSNLFSCLWFNEVERFTPRDQLSFAYVYHKLRRMNPEKPFRLNMFKDCERRAMAKLFRHRSEKKRNLPLEAIG